MAGLVALELLGVQIAEGDPFDQRVRLNSGMNPCANAPVPTIATLIPIILLLLRGYGSLVVSSSYQRMLMFLTRVWLSSSSNDSSLPIPLCFQPP